MFKNAYTRAVGFLRSTAGKTCAVIAGGVALLSASTPAQALPILDLSIASTAITTELTPALAAAMPIAGTIIAVSVGYKMFKHFVK